MKATPKRKGWDLRYRKDKARWVLAIEPPGGSRNWPTKTAPPEIQRESDARSWAAGLLAQRALEGPIGAQLRRSAGGSTVREHYLSWIVDVEKRPGLEPATVAGYKSAFKAWVLPMLGNELTASLDVARVRDWVRKLRVQKAKRGGKKVAEALDGRTISPMRVANTFSALSVFLSDMVADKKVSFTSNPCLDHTVRRELPDRPKPGQARIAGARPGIPTIADGQAAVDAAPDDATQLRFLIAFGQGFRDGEISGLRVGRAMVDADVAHFVIQEAVKIRGPKGFATPGKLKTASSERLVPMHPAVAAAIQHWLANGWRTLMHRAPEPNDFLLPGPTGGPARPKSSEFFRKALKAAKKDTVRHGRPLTFQGARNAFATALAEADVPREARKLLMGHTPDAVDEAHYTAHGLGKLAAFVARIPLTWTARPSVRPDVRPPAEQKHETHENQRAAPAGVGPATNGLGRRRGDRTGHPSLPGEPTTEAAPGRGTNDRMSSNGLGRRRRPNNGRTTDTVQGLLANASRIALESAWWNSADSLMEEA